MRRVVKIGGSLLTYPNLIESLHHWVSKQPPAETLCIVGGGEMIDAVRRLDAIHMCRPDSVHWICVDILQASFQLLASWCDWPTVNNSAELQERLRSGFPTDSPALIAVHSFYHPTIQTAEPVPLPHDWRTTTDAIAAWLAILTRANELVLLKSCDVSPTRNFQELADRGIVDEAFPVVGERIERVRIEKLQGIR